MAPSSIKANCTLPRQESLWDSEHPWAKVLRHADLRPKTRNFVIKRGFEVVVCTRFSRKDYAKMLRVSIPLPRMQPILLEV